MDDEGRDKTQRGGVEISEAESHICTTKRLRQSWLRRAIHRLRRNRTTIKMELTFTVPGRPQPKQRPRVSRGHAYTPKQTAEYERIVVQAAQIARVIPQSPLTGPLQVEITLYMPIAVSWSESIKEAARSGAIYPTSRPDIDNLAKAILDACNGTIYKDDAQIVRLILYKVYDDDPRAKVTIKEI